MTRCITELVTCRAASRRAACAAIAVVAATSTRTRDRASGVRGVCGPLRDDPGLRLSGLIAGADTSRRIDIAMMVWLLKGPDGRNVLVDAGFHRDDFVRRWKPVDFVPPSEAVARAGVKPEDVTDVIISHIHWDHLDGIDLFPKARIWIQREEFEHHIDSAGTVKDRAIDAGDAKFSPASRARAE